MAQQTFPDSKHIISKFPGKRFKENFFSHISHFSSRSRNKSFKEPSKGRYTGGANDSTQRLTKAAAAYQFINACRTIF